MENEIIEKFVNYDQRFCESTKMISFLFLEFYIFNLASDDFQSELLFS